MSVVNLAPESDSDARLVNASASDQRLNRPRDRLVEYLARAREAKHRPHLCSQLRPGEAVTRAEHHEHRLVVLLRCDPIGGDACAGTRSRHT